MSEQLLVRLTNPQTCSILSTIVVYLQRWHGWCQVELLLSRRVLCTPYNHAPCHFVQSHIRKGACVFDCNLPPDPLEQDRGLLRATVVARGWNGHRNKSQHRRLTHSSYRDSNPRPFNHKSGALTTELPNHHHHHHHHRRRRRRHHQIFIKPRNSNIKAELGKAPTM